MKENDIKFFLVKGCLIPLLVLLLVLSLVLLVVSVESKLSNFNNKLNNDNNNIDINIVNRIKNDLKISINDITSLKKIDFNSTIDNYDYVSFGKYNNINIDWFVLDKDSTRAILISKYIIDAKMFDSKSRTWEKSDIRKWLNNQFLNDAFDCNEQECIETVDLYTYSDNYILNYRSLESHTKDKVFLISSDEYINYGGLGSSKFTATFSNLVDIGYHEGYFWGRSPTKWFKTPNIIMNDGSKYSQDVYRTITSNEILGIRPVICVNYNNLDVEPFNIASSLKINDMGVTFQLPSDAVMTDSQNYNKIIYNNNDIQVTLSNLFIAGRDQKYDWNMTIELANSILSKTLGYNLDNVSDLKLFKISDNIDNAFYSKFIEGETKIVIVGISFDYEANNKIVVFEFKCNNDDLINKVIDSISLERENYWVKYIRENKDKINNEDKVYSFIINLSTGVFHKPSCKTVKRMKKVNKKEVKQTKRNMLKQGYHSCDICNP